MLLGEWEEFDNFAILRYYFIESGASSRYPQTVHRAPSPYLYPNVTPVCRGVT